MAGRRRSLAALAAVAGLAIAAPALALSGSVDGPAGATSIADRGAREQIGPVPVAPPVNHPALNGCDVAVLQRLTERDPDVAQWIIVSSASASSTTATLSIATVDDDHWRCSVAPVEARLGRNGTRPFSQRRSGDGTTPSGVFPLGVVATPQGPISFFGNSADPGARGPYRRVRPGDCYGANPGTPGYGHWRVDPSGCIGSDELLSSYGGAYAHAVLIGANTEPNVSGDAPGEIPYASAIFLHRVSVNADGSTRATSGCVAIEIGPLVAALRAIDPALDPHFAIGPRADLLA